MKSKDKIDTEETVNETESASAEAEETVEAEVCEEQNAEQKLAEKLEEAKDKLLRKIAEFDNYKKRTAKEKTENFSLGICEAAEKLIPVLDNLDRAVAAAETNDDKEALLEGIKMVKTQFADALASIGVSEIEAVGKEFDPEKHNAVMMAESDEPTNTVIEEFAKGYVYKKGDNERVIRHSMVKVSN